MRNQLTPALAWSVALIVSGPAAAAVVDESTVGDFSDDRFAPTALQLSPGVTVLGGWFGSSAVPDQHDLDYVTFTVPAGHVLSRMTLEEAYVGGAFSFVGMQAGPIVTIPATWTRIESPLLGWAHFGSATVGLDLLPDMAASPGSVGFAAPLPAGTYALWIMELDSSEAYRYAFGLEVTPVPAPATVAAVAAVLALGHRRRGR